LNLNNVKKNTETLVADSNLVGIEVKAEKTSQTECRTHTHTHTHKINTANKPLKM